PPLAPMGSFPMYLFSTVCCACVISSACPVDVPSFDLRVASLCLAMVSNPSIRSFFSSSVITTGAFLVVTSWRPGRLLAFFSDSYCFCATFLHTS
ncbi:hypothetical protein PMAYCL1PPCAC_09900, partial [Pristionchus mayeri]